MEEITAFMNKLPRNALEKIKNIEIPSFGPRPALASAGYGGGGGSQLLKEYNKENRKKLKEYIDYYKKYEHNDLKIFSKPK
ncbi:hypothetical protein [Bacillus sp. S10(2024)]|uniref:hypothetical protein n=1 Tax=Bacillus sp. S10(2024) TaxID=3162886 RepID=UPI003D20FF42